MRMVPGDTRVWALAALGGLIAAVALGGGCESYVRGRAMAQNGPLREGSLAWWIPRTINEEDALAWAMSRAAIIIDNADTAGLKLGERRRFTLEPMRRGEPAMVWLGSAAAITEDGYFLTAAHCLSSEPFVIVAKERGGSYVERPGRVVWSGQASDGVTDVALVHAPDLATSPLLWCDLSNARGGVEVLCVGVGVGTVSRLAAGKITGGPTGTFEAAPARALAFRVSAPLVPGDSGGPAILADGSLLGISATVEVGLVTGSGGGEILRPDPAFIQSRIDADRAQTKPDRLHP